MVVAAPAMAMITAGGAEWSGAEGIRTLDLGIANATLSQLSYRPSQWAVL